MDGINEEDVRLIYSIIYRYYRSYSNKEDLFQVGYIGLMNAKRNFDSSLGFKFSTFAFKYIKGEIFKYINQDKNFKISRNLTMLYLKINKVKALLTQKLMREPSVLELSKYLGYEEELIIEALESQNVILNIDDTEPIYRDNIIDNICLKDELNKLSYEELCIINSRFNEDLTQMETAENLGISQVKVSRMEQKIKTKLKNKLIA